MRPLASHRNRVGEQRCVMARPAGAATNPHPAGRMLIAVLLSGLLLAGCSRPKRQPEDVDFGQVRQRRFEPTEPPQPPRREPPATRPTDPGPAGTRGNAGEEGADGQGSAAGDGQSEDGSGGDGAGPGSGPSAEAGEGDRDQGGDGRGGTAGNGAAPGRGEDPPAPMAPAPALPGREPLRPALSADAAVKSATRLLDQARAAMRQGEAGKAAEAAIDAYDQVLPHAQTDKPCGKLCREIEKLLEATGRRRGPAAPVPTRFE